MKFSISLIVAGFMFASVASADELMTVARRGNAAVVQLSSGKHSGPQIWTLKPFQTRALLSVDNEKTRSHPAIARDGKWVAWGCKDGTLRVFSARNGSLRARPGHAHIARKDAHSEPYEVRTLAFSPDGKTLAWANAKGVFLWNWRRHKLLYSRPLPTPYYRSLQEPVVLSFSGDGRYLAVAGQDKTGSDDQEDAHIFLLDSAAGSLRHRWTIDCGDGEPTALEFSPNAISLLVVSDWHVSMSSYDKVDLFSLHREEPLWHHDNIIFYPYEDGARQGTTGESDRFPNFAAFSRDGTRVAIGGYGADYGDNFLEFRRASDGKVLSLTNKPSGVLPLSVQKKLRPELTFH